MQVNEIVRLTRQNVAELMTLREQNKQATLFKRSDRRRPEESNPCLFEGPDRRCSPKSDRRQQPSRWPFPGMVELLSEDSNYQTPSFATCIDVSLSGLGLVTDSPFSPGTVVDFACHLPEMTICGQATVKRCTETQKGYAVGVEFILGD